MAAGKSRKLFFADHCLTPYENINTCAILCEKDRIIALGGASAFIREEGVEVTELTDSFAMPGFIDSHVHGAGAFDVSEAENATNEDMDRMSMALAKHGVTSFFPTTISAPKDKMIRTAAALARMIDCEHPGADPTGIHIEGPFINPVKAGVQDKRFIYPVDLKFTEELIAAGQGRIKLMTFAPELENADKLIELLLNNGIIPSMGHSLAGEEDVIRAIDAGACRCTHLFNGMPPLHHRKPELTLDALTDNRVAVEIIADPGHLHPRMIELASRVKPRDKIIGISNAIDPEAVAPEERSHYTVSDGVVFRDGVIAGTSMALDTGWLHLSKFAKLPRTTAAACFTANPARDLGLITRGELKPGKKADITFFDTETDTVRMTVVRGKIVYDAGKDEENSKNA